MGVKYRCDYKDSFDNQCRIDISHEDYSSDPILLRGVGGQACTLFRDLGDDPYEPIANTKADLSFYQTEELPIDISELQVAQDREFIVTLYINSAVKFKGFIIPDGIQRSFKPAPYEFNISATDGLKLLPGITYSHNNLDGGRCILNYFRQILFSDSNLGLMLPIRWVNSMTNDAFPLEEDIFSGSVEWASRGEGFTDYNGNTKDCMYIIEGMLRSMQSRITQDNGKWVIWRINDVASGSFLHRETPANLDGFEVVTSEVVNEIKKVYGVNSVTGHDYSFIQEDAITTISPALKTVKTTYNQDQRENILPNGNMDIVVGIFNSPLYWGLLSPLVGTVESSVSLSEAKGSSVKITTDLGAPNIFRLDLAALPIDTDVLYTYINFGFKYMIESGATVDGDGIIQWGLSSPFRIQVIYYAGDKTYYLNEFGFWTETTFQIELFPDNVKQGDVVQLDFNAKQNLAIPLPSTSPIARETKPYLYVGFNIQDNIVMYLDDIYVNTDTNSDVYEAVMNSGTNTGKEEYELNISSSHNGFYVSNYMSDFSQSGNEKFFSDGHLTAATLTEMNSHAILRNRYKASEIFEGSIFGVNYSYCEIYNIEGLEGKNFLPLRSSWNTETNTISLTAIEIRDNGTGIFTSHYGSNSNTDLSN